MEEETQRPEDHVIPQLEITPTGSRQWFPWLVPAILVANVVVFVVTMYVNDCPHNTQPPPSCFPAFLGRFSFQPREDNPLYGPSEDTLLKMGALDENRIVHNHQPWRLITCIWLHSGIVHIFYNMLSLLLFGIRLELEFGYVRIGILYVISGLGGSLLSALFSHAVSVGASGAIMGFLGSALSELITNWRIYANKFAVLLILLFIIAINVVSGLSPHVDNFAHAGGFISGFLLGLVILIRPQYGNGAALGCHTGPVKHKLMYQYVLSVIAAVLLIPGFVVGFVMLFN
ncbi:RHOMBOID-like protein 2 [Typha latifolia]|uniref:RHOMBOID-like protein 2 n=1 Tax=Typha latifolia TaxID=4733 RepID=UPI003C3004B6